MQRDQASGVGKLTSVDRMRLARVLALLGSNHPGERDAAGLAAHRIVQGAGSSWEEVVAQSRMPSLPPPADPATSDLQICLRHAAHLSAWEREFCQTLTSCLRWSPRQRAKLAEIAGAIRMKGQS